MNAINALRAHPSPFSKRKEERIFNEVVKMFYHQTFCFELPRMSDQAWNTVCSDIAETERLEFMGDSAIGDAVAEIVVKLHPGGDPHCYTQIKSTLTCNAFFANLMYRLGFTNEGETTKEAADAFETIIGLFKREHGAQAVADWAWVNYSPLVDVAWEIWGENREGFARHHRRYLLPHHKIQMRIKDRREYLLAQGPLALGSGTKDDPFLIE